MQQNGEGEGNELTLTVAGVELEPGSLELEVAVVR
jgi:hypothetical protein